MDVADRANFQIACLYRRRYFSPMISLRGTPLPFQPPTMGTQSRRDHAWFSLVRGFTLLEVLVAMSVFTVVTIGIYTTLIQSYQLVGSARLRDNARAVLESFGDQFLRLETTDLVQPGNVVTIRPFFQIYTVPTGVGLSWTDQAGNTTTGTAQGLPVTLVGAGGNTVIAMVTETVRDLDDTFPPTSSTGSLRSGTVYTAAGRMLTAQFTITYTLGNRVRTQTLTVARSAQ
jgi:prepilin-type N-terminal cleavage/methylation domain-containing protein